MSDRVALVEELDGVSDGQGAAGDVNAFTVVRTGEIAGVEVRAELSTLVDTVSVCAQVCSIACFAAFDDVVGAVEYEICLAIATPLFVSMNGSGAVPTL